MTRSLHGKILLLLVLHGAGRWLGCLLFRPEGAVGGSVTLLLFPPLLWGGGRGIILRVNLCERNNSVVQF